MNFTDADLYLRAIEAARNELQGIRAEYERLAKRKAQLEAFIANGEPLIPEGPRSQPVLDFPQPPQPAGGEFPVSLEKVPRWKAITLSINGKKDRFTVGEALDALERIGRPVKSKNKFQIVRAELLRNARVFHRYGDGTYGVKGEELHGS